MKKEELTEIIGGAVSATLINALSRGLSCLYDLGRALGSSIRRIAEKNICSL